MGQPKPNPWIMSLAPYVAGQAKVDGAGKVVKLSANESPLGPSPKAIEAARQASAALHLYPDPDSRDLRQAIASAHGLSPDRVICGAGSDEILHVVAQAFVKPGDEIIHSQYGFMMYPIIAQTLGAKAVAIPNRNWGADVDGILAAVTDKTRIVFLDNPNNPTGVCLARTEVERLINGLPKDCVLVYDAAYAECVDQADYTDGSDLVERYDNVLMTRTFSKLYGLAALRIGWGYGSPALIDPMNRIRMPFNANVPAQKAAIAAVADQSYLADVTAYTIKWRTWLAAEIMALGLDVVPSQTNFVLIQFPDDKDFSAEAANAYLTAQGYLLRWLPGLGLTNCLRLTVGTEQDNHAVIALLRAFVDRGSYPDA